MTDSDTSSSPPFDGLAARRVTSKIDGPPEIELVGAFLSRADDGPIKTAANVIVDRNPEISVGGNMAVDEEGGTPRIGCLFRFEMSLKQDAGDEPDGAGLFLGADFRVTYSVSDLDGVSKDDLNVFGFWNGLLTAWPYWREYVSSTTQKAGILGVVIPVYKVPVT